MDGAVVEPASATPVESALSELSPDFLLHEENDKIMDPARALPTDAALAVLINERRLKFID